MRLDVTVWFQSEQAANAVLPQPTSATSTAALASGKARIANALFNMVKRELHQCRFDHSTKPLSFSMKENMRAKPSY